MAAVIFGISAHRQVPLAGFPSHGILAENPKRKWTSFSCRSSSANTQLQQTYEYDLYELLGVDRNASLQDIRKSYRWLQKKCHPDIAGAVGHDMSILLNQAYTTLADPNQRAVYDQSYADSSELQGYTGCPLYSKWFGPPEEERAVFVDESRCVGCLKCALIAPNTFAIENRFGRARAVGQWADPPHVIKDALKACPVDCITWVNRSQLAAFEFIMSKQPRVAVGVDAHSNGGVRSTDVFKGVEKLFEKLKQQERSRMSNTNETPAQREARLAAMEGVHTRSGRWWYYFVGNPNTNDQASPSFSREAHGAIVPLSFYHGENRQGPDSRGDRGGGNVGFEHQGELHHLFEAARTRRHKQAASPGGGRYDEEYWVPLSPISSAVSSTSKREPMVTIRGEKGKGQPMNKRILEGKLNGWMRNIVSGGPVVTAAVAAWFVAVTAVPGAALSSSEMGVGLVPLDWMQSVEMQVISVAAIWYLIGAAVANATVIAVNLIDQGKEDGSH